MVFSRRQTIVSLLLLLSFVVSAQSQSAVHKAATSTISGKVTIGGKGLQGVVVGLVISDQYHSNTRPTRFRSTTDEDGIYRITNVPPGTYEVIPASPAYVAIEGGKSLIVGKNETVENIDIALERGGMITGKVTDADGCPVIEETVDRFALTNFNSQVTGLKTIQTISYKRCNHRQKCKIAFDDQFAYLATPDGLFRTSRIITPDSPLTFLGFANYQIQNLYIHQNVLYVAKVGGDP